jgi:hypothetical protein
MRGSRILQWLRARHNKYLDEKRTVGGYERQFVADALRDAKADPDASGLALAMDELFCRAAEGIWHDDPPPPELELFHVAGVEIGKSYTFPDLAAPGGYRRVKGRWSTARQVQADAFIKRGKADELARAAARAQQDAARLLAEVQGNADALLWDYRDRGQVAA